MSDATTAAPAASPAPDATTAAPVAAPAPAAAAMLVDDPAAAPAAAPAPTAAPAATPAPTPAPTAAPAPAAAVPEKYEFALPEGVKVDEARVGKFSEWAKSNNLTQEAAQAAMDMAVDMQNGNLEQLQTTIRETATAWHNASLTDKEFGGDKYAENLAIAKTALAQFGTPELSSFLKESHIQAHPEMLRFMVRVGQAISQDGFVPGRAGAGKGPTPQRMYSESNMNP